MKRADRTGNDYALIAVLYPWVDRALHSCRQSVTEAVQKHNLSRILDMGCGTGTQVIRLRAAGSAAVGIDISWPMLRRVGREVRHAGFFVRGNGCLLPFPAKVFDGLIYSLSLHEKPHGKRLAMLAEGYRVLKPGGTVFVLDYACPTHGSARMFMNLLNMVECMAGRNHYKAFRDFMKRGATQALLEAAGLRILSCTFHFHGTIGLYEGRWESQHPLPF
ncbi:MAG: class I SAM-dependent methyltransferase [Desulfosoma sp.]